jgi:ribosomal protein S18 acetylase RimI-like enzyme
MTDRVVRTNLMQKATAGVRTLFQQGPAGLARKIREYSAYHLDAKWSFVYLAYDLSQPFMRMPMDPAVTVRTATTADRPRIDAELFPIMVGEQEYEKRYFGLLGDPGVLCYLAERDGLLNHYSWVFLDAAASPIVDTPFDATLLRPGDVYIGPVFTSPAARGFIYPQVLATIVRDLTTTPAAKRIVVLVQGRNAAAVSYYKRLRFIELPAPRQPAWSSTVGRLIRRQPTPR